MDSWVALVMHWLGDPCIDVLPALGHLYTVNFMHVVC
jgi:hypothetical protein